jgi:hypothetical protein
MKEILVFLTDRRLKFASGDVRFDVTFTVTEILTAQEEVVLILTKAIVLINPGS